MAIKTRNKLSEHQLQVQIVGYLRVKGIYCFSVPNGFWNGIKDTRKKCAYISKLKREGFLNGVADLIVLQPKAKTTFLELKVGYNKQSIHQKRFEEIVSEMGFKYYVVKSLDEVVNIFG
jgi:hypothetical protein